MELLARTPWPGVAGGLANPEAEADFERMRSLVSAIREARSSKNIDPRRRVSLHADADLIAAIRSAGGVVETLALLDRVTAEPAPSDAASALFLFEARELALSGLADAVDPDVERRTLRENMAKLEKDIALIEKRLANPGYADKAPAKLVQETRDQLAQKRAERDTAERRLGEIA